MYVCMYCMERSLFLLRASYHLSLYLVVRLGRGAEARVLYSVDEQIRPIISLYREDCSREVNRERFFCLVVSLVGFGVD